MKRSILLVAACAVCSFVIASCSSSTSPSSANNNSSGDTPFQNTGDSYYPLTEGSTWTYVGAQNYTVTATGDSTGGGITWRRLVASTGASAFARWNGNQLKGINIAPVALAELEVLDITPGAMWSFDININGGDTHYAYKDSLQGLTKTIQGKTYSDVIELRMVYSTNYGGITLLSDTATYFYAKGVGMIEANIGAIGTIDLQSYSIK
ncbi:MAG TPA: hypothetical protein VEW28_06120 [Candidatus Kapabacteria bacterium]|nr:hypothetical protein [Candidatus Kapabacteria bacterium]